MNKPIQRAGMAALALAFSAPAGWAQSISGATVQAGGAANLQGPGWNGGYGPWMMGGWGDGWHSMMGYGGGGWIMMLLMVVIVVALLVFLVRATAWQGHPYHGAHPQPPARPSGLDVLDERYARGDINREEYQQKKRDILGG